MSDADGGGAPVARLSPRSITLREMLRRYRALGADPPFGDPRRAHGLGMEGYFWRITDPGAGRVIVALCGLCRDERGTWANVALAAHPGGFVRSVDLPRAGAREDTLGVWASTSDGTPALRADTRGVTVDLGEGARMRVQLGDPRPGRRAMLGGLGPAHLVPGLGQYWHPHLLGSEVDGSAELAGERIELAGARGYAEKNWGDGGFPSRWWWGEAHDFEGADLCLAFAGGALAAGPATFEATGVVARLGGRRLRLGNPVLAPARVDAGAGHWSLRARGPRYSVELEGEAGPSAPHALPVPDLAARRSVLGVHEHLAGRLHAVIRRRGRVQYAGESALAGLELGPAGGVDTSLAPDGGGSVEPSA